MAFQDLPLAKGEILRIPLDAQEWVRYGRVVRLGRTDFDAKPEVHITIVNKGLGQELDGLIDREASIEGRVRRALNTAIQERGWLQGGCCYARGSLHHVAKDKDRVDEQGNPYKLHVESIIQRVEVPGIDAFYVALGEIVGQPLVAPPTHVTLYALGDPRGISLADQKAWKECVKREISPEELVRVR